MEEAIPALTNVYPPAATLPEKPDLIFAAEDRNTFPLSLEWLTPYVESLVLYGQETVKVFVVVDTTIHFCDAFDMSHFMRVANSYMDTSNCDFRLISVTVHCQHKRKWVQEATPGRKAAITEHHVSVGGVLLEFGPIRLIDL